jgi:hypothetical protein
VNEYVGDWRVERNAHAFLISVLDGIRLYLREKSPVPTA